MAKNEKFSYEDAKKRLDQILMEIDSGKVGIDELEVILAEAKELVEKSLQKLSNAEKIILKWES
ncbi:MAG: exodeoxyribonuclease VII small subunit [Bacteroidia bacterium]|jgi:exonuclease VII small subunit|nr:exodeoxyribonuclease VII small subunit [Bacteroidia bacterium]